MWITNGQPQIDRQKKVRTTVGSKYGAGEGGDITWGVYAGEVGALTGWNGAVVGIGGENGGLGCEEMKEGLDWN